MLSEHLEKKHLHFDLYFRSLILIDAKKKEFNFSCCVIFSFPIGYHWDNRFLKNTKTIICHFFSFPFCNKLIIRTGIFLFYNSWFSLTYIVWRSGLGRVGSRDTQGTWRSR